MYKDLLREAICYSQLEQLNTAHTSISSTQIASAEPNWHIPDIEGIPKRRSTDRRKHQPTKQCPGALLKLHVFECQQRGHTGNCKERIARTASWLE